MILSFSSTKTDKLRNVWKFSFNFLILSISFLVFLFVLVSDTTREGLEFLFLLPLSLMVCTLFFGRIFEYNGIGYKIFYAIVILRYLIQPILIILTNGSVSFLRMSVVEPLYYRMALVVESLELFVSFLTIRIFGRRNNTKERHEKFQRSNKNNENVIWCFRILLALYLLILLYRFAVWFPALNIYGFKQSTRDGIVLENSIFSAAKTILFILLLIRAKNSFGNRKFLWLMASILMCLFNVMSYFGSNRSLILEIALTSITLMIVSFPSYRRVLLIVMVPIASAVAIYMFISKQFSLDSLSQVNNLSLDLQYFSNQLEEYTNGPWCIAQSISSSRGLSVMDRFHSVIKDVNDGLIVLYELPFLKGLNAYSNGWRSSAEIMKFSFETYDRGQMLSFSGGLFINFGTFGWLAFPLYSFVAMRLFVFFNNQYANVKNDLFKKYIYLWSAILFSLTYCYCTQTLLYCMSKYILFIWVGYLVAAILSKSSKRSLVLYEN